MEKIDYKKKDKELFNPSAKEISEVEVPAFNFIMIDGKGDPGKPGEYSEAIEALYPVAYGIKFHIKKTQGVDYGVMPLEGLWWAEDFGDYDPEKGNRDNWLWTAMIRQPEFVTKEIFEELLTLTKKKKNLPALEKIRFESYKEGKSAQMMHIGPYLAEAPNIMKIHEYIKSNGHKLSGKHHEIYLGDPRKSAPEKLKTVIRQPYA